MVDPIRKLSLADFTELLGSIKLIRQIDAVHLHHTWRPRHKDFRGLSTIEAMRRYHMEEEGWSDIAQHLTIDPAGGLWTGRNWNMPPASAKGHNGTAAAGPFMIEMVGDFDIGRDRFEGTQENAAVEVVAQLLLQLVTGKGTTLAAISQRVCFHNQFTNQKTCPGSGFNQQDFLQKVVDRVAISKTSRAKQPAIFASDLLAGSSVARALGWVPPEEDSEVTESETAGELIQSLARSTTAQRQALERASRRIELREMPAEKGRSSADFPYLRRHVINLSAGELSSQGQFQTDPDDLVRILESFGEYASRVATPRMVIHAHGGLVSETGALEYAERMREWWLSHGVFPVFFVWETGILDILRTRILGARGDVSDALLEAAAKIPATALWSAIKDDARKASSPDASGGNPGGAYLFAHELHHYLGRLANPAVELHAIGHSAGAVFHSNFVPLLVRGGARITTLSLLAPAVRTDVFAASLQPLVGAGIGRLSLFTMEEDAERQDSVAGIYRKSLLYFVSRACEGFRRRPILGLYQSLRKDGALSGFFGIGGPPAPSVELQLAMAPGSEPNPLTKSLQHGYFDNDVATMSAVLRRILGRAPVPGGDEGTYGSANFPDFPEPSRVVGLAGTPPGEVPGNPSAISEGRPGGARRALCVGIDDYRSSPLNGCVNDARTWGEALRRLDFEVQYLLDRQATREGILTGLRSLIAGAKNGDVLVFQYAGHGSQLPDLGQDESDRFDETLVPHDYDIGAFLIDDDLAEVLQALPAKVSMTLFMDCCHCGTNSRFAPIFAPRSRAASSEKPRFLRLSPQQQEAHLRFRRARGSALPVTETALPGVIHFAACQDDELAYESDGHGHFTAVATRLLAQASGGGTTNEDFLRAVREEVARDGRQHPGLLPPAPGMIALRILSALGG